MATRAPSPTPANRSASSSGDKATTRPSAYQDLPSHLTSWPSPPPPTSVGGLANPDEWLSKVGPLCGIKDKKSLWAGITRGDIPAVQAGKLGEVLPVPVSFSSRLAEEWLVPCDPAAFHRDSRPLRAVVIAQNGQPFPTSVTTTMGADAKTRDESTRQAIRFAAGEGGHQSHDLGKAVGIAWVTPDAQVRIIELRQRSGEPADPTTVDSRRIVSAVDNMKTVTMDDLQRNCAEVIKVALRSAIVGEREPAHQAATAKALTTGVVVSDRTPPARSNIAVAQSDPARQHQSPSAPSPVAPTAPSAPTTSSSATPTAAAGPSTVPVATSPAPVSVSTTAATSVGGDDPFMRSQLLRSTAAPGPNSGHAVMVVDNATGQLAASKANGQPLRAYAGITPTAVQFWPRGTISKGSGSVVGHADEGSRVFIAEKSGNDKLRILGTMSFGGVIRDGGACQVQADVNTFSPLAQPIEVSAPGASKGAFMVAREYPETVSKGVPNTDRERLWHELTTAVGWA